jgi:putative peptidoglycan lipid II flippase
VLGQAVGLASLPFFARLYSENRYDDFAKTVNNSVSRLGAISLLATSWMIVVSLPLVDLAFRRGKFDLADSQETATYFLMFSFSLIFWAVQGLYARGFYAAGDTVRPMVAGTLITALSLPIYWMLFRRFGVIGLAVASNIAIVMHTLVLAVMLDLRGLVRLSQLDWAELAKALAAAVVAGLIAAQAGQVVPFQGTHLSALLNMLWISLTWTAAVAAGLWITRSELLVELRKRL